MKVMPWLIMLEYEKAAVALDVLVDMGSRKIVQARPGEQFYKEDDWYGRSAAWAAIRQYKVVGKTIAQLQDEGEWLAGSETELEPKEIAEVWYS